MEENPVVVVQRKADVPAHLWPDPDKVRCHCGEPVERIEMLRSGGLRWVCTNGHTDLIEQTMKRAKEPK